MQLFERERFPRFHIGESLIPETYWVLKRLNMLPKMQQSHFVKKYSVQFVNAAGKLSAPFYFWDNKPHECSQTWQVVRSEFDRMMLDNAREHGVEAHEGIRVVDVLFENGPTRSARVGVTIQFEGGARRDVRAKVVVDASGQNGLLQNRFRLRVWDPLLNKGAVWTYWKGAYRDTGRDEGATMVLQTANKKGWFWYIPLHDDLVSVGVVAPFDYLFKDRGDREQTYHEEVERCPAVKERVVEGHARDRLLRDQGLFVSLEASRRRRLGAHRRCVSDFSTRSIRRECCSPSGPARWRPTPSSRVWPRDDLSAAQLGKWGPGFNEGVDRMRRLVCEYYDGFSFGNFVRNYPELKNTVTDLLIGDLFTDRVDKVWGPMESLHPRQAGRSPAGTTARRKTSRRARRTS